MTLTLPCPDCNGDGFLSTGDRHAETRTDVCPRCRGRMVIPAATGEAPEASARPKAIDSGRTAYEARYAHTTLGPRGLGGPAWDDLPAEARAVWARVEAACARCAPTASSADGEGLQAFERHPHLASAIERYGIHNSLENWGLMLGAINDVLTTPPPVPPTRVAGLDREVLLNATALCDVVTGGGQYLGPREQHDLALKVRASVSAALLAAQASAPGITIERTGKDHQGVTVRFAESEYDSEVFRIEEPLPGLMVVLDADGSILSLEIADLQADMVPPEPTPGETHSQDLADREPCDCLIGDCKKDRLCLEDVRRQRRRELARATPGETPGQDAVATAIEALDELLNYQGGADSALDDEYVLDRARTALASLRSTQADTGGESQTPAPAGGAVEAVPYGIIDPDYARVFTIARCIAWQEGYALLMHGSFTRDLDLLAVPWTEQAADAEHMVGRIEAALDDLSLIEQKSKAPWQGSEKPHGRRAWTFTFKAFGDPRFVDLSVMPRAALAAIAQGPGAGQARADALNAAIQHALSRDTDGLEWLRDWNEGDKEAMDELVASLPAAPATAASEGADRTPGGAP